MRPPVQSLKFLAIDVQVFTGFTLKFYNNISKTGFEFIIKRLQCALPQHSYTAPAAAGCKLQLLLTQNCHRYILEIWIMM